MIRARVRITVADRAISNSLVLAVKPDNLLIGGGVSIAGAASSSSTTFLLAYEGKVETFIFTLDDLLRCVQAAKETLDKIAKKKME